MKSKNYKNEEFRYERKFIMDNSLYSSFDFLNQFLPNDFYECFPSRKINSIYFDTDQLHLANKSVEGHSERYKVRIRFYGETKQFYNPVLEIKEKIGNVGIKKFIKIKKNDLLMENFSLRALSFTKSLYFGLDNLLLELKPIIFVSYIRNYFSSSISYVRATFDDSIIFKDLNSCSILNTINNSNEFKYDAKIIEFKYLKDLDQNIYHLTNKLPLRLNSCSKYITGLRILEKI